MNEHVFPEDEILCEPQSTRTAYLPASAGSFARRRAHYFSQLRKPLLTAEQQQALIKLVREGDAGARKKIVAHNMHLVIDFAKHYANRGLAPLDLIREGTQGLIRALEEYEPTGSFSFLAFATWCICQNIERAIMNLGSRFCRHPSKPPIDRHAGSSPMPALPNRPFDNFGGRIGLPA